MPLSLVIVGRTPWSAADALVGLPRADDSVRYPSAAAHLWETRGLVIVITGIYYALALAAAGALVTWLASPWAAVPLWLLALFCLYFFRDPEREIPSGPVAVSPADGMVVAVKPESATQNRISIFLNVFDVHVNRTPIGGTIAKVQYRRGAFHVASREECSVQNEQNVVTVQGKGTTVVFKQIAGLIARRIVFNKKPGDCVSIGERIGLIKFGSRCDVLFGPEWEIVVRPGMRVAGGSSVIARLRGKDQPNVD
jgi:phosphatidylserine decarboxylase